jgi:subtilase family serine protease
MLRYLRWKKTSMRVVALPAAGALVAVMAGAVPAAAAPAGNAPSVRPSVVPERVGAAPRIPTGAHALGRATASTAVSFDIVLQSRDASGLQSLASEVSSPGSAEYHHFLSPAQFTARFGQTPQTVQRVVAALRKLGLATGTVSSNNLVIPVRTTVGQASASLHTSFTRYQLASGRMAIANTEAPLLPAAVAQVTEAVVGLNTLLTVKASPPRLRGAATPNRAAAPNVGPTACAAAASTAAASGGWTYPQLARAYSINGLFSKGHEGAKATVGLFELESFSHSDVSTFQTCYGTHVPVSTVNVDGGGPSGDTTEAALDIETVIALAPKTKLIVYEAPGSNYSMNTIDEYTKIVDQNRIRVLSTSYGICEKIVNEIAPGLIRAENLVFEQAATQGISVFAAAGDSGSEACEQDSAGNELAVQDPAAQPFLTGVGGTDLTALGPKPTERVWNERAIAEGAGGGGKSSQWAKPSYQRHTGVVSRTREVPDVTASADPSHGYAIFDAADGGWIIVGGTSAAAPLWAAMTADIDSGHSASGRVGFLNPQLYRLPRSAFNDITVGNNDYTGTHGGRYRATKGYDLASGLGSPIATKLAADLKRFHAAKKTIFFVGKPGTRKPPSKLGPYRMKKFRADTRKLTNMVSTVKGPTGTVHLSPKLEHLKIADGWATWSNKYKGSVYFSSTSEPEFFVTVRLPARTKAFYLYAEPDAFETFSLSATAQDGTSSKPLKVFGNSGAKFFGFYARGKTTLKTIIVTCSSSFAIGEFGIAR